MRGLRTLHSPNLRSCDRSPPTPYVSSLCLSPHHSYILAPGGDGILSSKAVGGGRCCFGGIFGYGNLTPAIMVLHALTMPMVRARGWVSISRPLASFALPLQMPLPLPVAPLRRAMNCTLNCTLYCTLGAQLSLLDTGMPILWREVAARWWHGNTLKRMAKSDGRYTALRDDPLAA